MKIDQHSAPNGAFRTIYPTQIHILYLPILSFKRYLWRLKYRFMKKICGKNIIFLGGQKKNETTISKSQLFLLILLPFLKINP